MSVARKKILFAVENVTLAQVVRLLVLAKSLDPARYEVHFACSRFDELLFAGTSFHKHELYTLPQEQLFEALDKGKRLYEKRTLGRYIDEELALIAKIQPDLVVGDFRLSLAVSVPASRVPLATLINAYWSPYAARDAFPVPDHPIVRLIGLDMAQRYFPKAMPKVFAHFAAPVNALRKRHGLAPLGSLLEVLTHGDHTLYPDVPSLTPTRDLPANHHYLGPILWAPDVPLPAWWNELDQSKPMIYVTLGSSGKVDALPPVLEALSTLPVTVLLATAGRVSVNKLPDNVRAADYLPGDLAARRSALVVCNGGSTTGYQALSEGVPVVGVAWNFDQYLATDAMQRAGVAELVRAGSISAERVREAVRKVLDSESYRTAARRVAGELASMHAIERFAAFLDQALGAPDAVGAAGQARGGSR